MLTLSIQYLQKNKQVHKTSMYKASQRCKLWLWIQRMLNISLKGLIRMQLANSSQLHLMHPMLLRPWRLLTTLILRILNSRSKETHSSCLQDNRTTKICLHLIDLKWSKPSLRQNGWESTQTTQASQVPLRCAIKKETFPWLSKPLKKKIELKSS